MAVLGPVLLVGTGVSVIASLRTGRPDPMYVGVPIGVAGSAFMVLGVPLALEANRRCPNSRWRPGNRVNTGALIGTLFTLSVWSLVLAPVVPRAGNSLLAASAIFYTAATVSSVAWSADNRRSFQVRPSAWLDPLNGQGGLAIRGRW